MVRLMKTEDYQQVFNLWNTIKGLRIRSKDDMEERICAFIDRNPLTCFVATVNEAEAGNAGNDDNAGNEKIVGSLLCGHDGRRACFYHVCVKEEYRKKGFATEMMERALNELKKQHISKVNLMAFCDNEIGNKFWQDRGWSVRDDVNLYEYNLNPDNISEVVL